MKETGVTPVNGKAMHSTTLRRKVSLLALAALWVLACRSGSPDGSETSSSSPGSGVGAAASGGAEGATAPVAVPVSREKVQAVLNRAGLPPYSGPVGTVRGVITVTGDAAPDLDEVLAKIPEGKGCERARGVYGKLFREGSGRTLADALVAVTGYRGFVAPRDEATVVEARDCAFSRRTYVLTFGQRMDVLNRDAQTYIPQLLGAHQPALLVAMPGGQAVKLFPTEVGQYRLVDQSHPYATADVFVLAYPTATVTGLDGRFELAGIPVGKVKVSTFLPVTGQTVEREVEVRSGQPTIVDLAVPFDAQKNAPNAQR